MTFPRIAIAVTTVLTAGVVWAVTEPSTRQPSSATTSPKIDLIFVQAPVVTTGELANRFPQGSRIVRRRPKNTLSPVANLTPGFFAAADPQVSFDGTKVLFSARQERGATWQIWEMKADGSAKRQITQGTADCLRPAYLPRGEIAYTAVVREGGRSVSQLYVSKLDGSGPHPATFGPGNYQLETVLQNGRILVSAESPLVPGTDKSRQFYLLRPDGSGLAPFRCEHDEPSIRTEADELDDGTVVSVKSQRGAKQPGGELAQLRRGALHNGAITPTNTLFWSPRKLNGNKVLVARRSASKAGTSGKFDLYSLDSTNGKPGELVYEDPALSSVQAVPVAPRPTPRWYWSTVNPEDKAGYFVCMDSRLSREAPGGRIAQGIASVRILALDEVNNRENTLGLAPVEQDGSFYIAVPPDRPVRFELLDANGAVIRAQRSWIWARPGEERGCVGCHEDRAIAPENRWPQALRRFDTPIRLGLPPQTTGAH